MDTILSILLIILIIFIYLLILNLVKNDNILFTNQNNKIKFDSKCDVHSCKSIDPVSDPKYNMQQIVKQSILLEEHLSNKNKRCRDCITKHFLHIIGLAEEAQMLATNKIKDYPLIPEAVKIYNDLFNLWLKSYGTENEKTVLYCSDILRNMRKKLIVVYFFDEKYKIKKEEI